MNMAISAQTGEGLVAIKSNIKDILKEKGVTAYKLAILWGKRSNYVYTLVNKEQLPEGTDIKTLVDIARILEVPVERLFTVEE